MKTLALVLAALVLAPAAAHAGGNGFVSLGVGGSVNTGGDLDGYGADRKAGSLFVGQKFGMFGLEAGLTAYGIEGPQGASFSNVGLAAAGRFTLPVTPVIGPYLRLGIERTWMNRDTGLDFSGTGWIAGLGAEYKLDFGFAPGTLWVDFTRHDAKFVNDVAERNGHIDVISLGASVSF